MRTSKGIGGTAMVVIVLLAGVGLFLGAQQAGLLSATTGPDAAGGDDDSKASLYFKANDALASSQPSYVNVSYELENSEGLDVASGSTDTTQGFVQITDLDENEDYTLRLYDDDGSGSDYYYSEKVHTTNEGVKRVVQDVEKEGSATTDIFETSGSADDDDKLKISQGATETMDVEVKENTQNAKLRQPALVLKTNDTDAVTNLEVSGSTASEVPDRLSSYDDLFDTGTAEIVDFNKEEYTVQVERGESNTDTATVDIAVVDLAHYQNDNGDWVEGYEDQDDNDVGASDANTNTVTVIN